MRNLVISDLHANEEALSAVLRRAENEQIDRLICLGDFVGYGARPNEVVEMIREYPGEALYVRGNHDRVAVGYDDGSEFNHAALAAALWTRDSLTDENRRFLEELPLGPTEDGEGIMLCHGSPHDEDEYLFTDLDAARIFLESEAPVILLGHTHLPTVFELDLEAMLTGHLINDSRRIELDLSCRYLVNPGSVGQPRDRNPLASFAILDTEVRTVEFIRVPYDIASTQRSIIEAGLPRILADRLGFGF